MERLEGKINTKVDDTQEKDTYWISDKHISSNSSFLRERSVELFIWSKQIRKLLEESYKDYAYKLFDIIRFIRWDK